MRPRTDAPIDERVATDSSASRHRSCLLVYQKPLLPPGFMWRYGVCTSPGTRGKNGCQPNRDPSIARLGTFTWRCVVQLAPPAWFRGRILSGPTGRLGDMPPDLPTLSFANADEFGAW